MTPSAYEAGGLKLTDPQCVQVGKNPKAKGFLVILDGQELKLQGDTDRDEDEWIEKIKVRGSHSSSWRIIASHLPCRCGGAGSEAGAAKQ
jgi:hypothetical protein